MDNSSTGSKRPYVICHVISSLDGRISGSAFELPETIDAMDEHWKIRADFGCEAVMNGSTTAAEIYADGFLCEDELRECGPGTGDARAGETVDEIEAATTRDSETRCLRQDHIAGTELESYVVCIDPEGSLRWSCNYVDRPVQPKSHVIEVLLETVSDAYLEYLRALEISYIFAGSDDLDVELLLKKLVACFGIGRLLITGGGIIDWTMLRAGAIDEVSVIITPTIGGERDVATMFDRPAGPGAEGTISRVDHFGGEPTSRTAGIDEEGSTLAGVPLELIEVRELAGGALHLRYRPR